MIGETYRNYGSAAGAADSWERVLGDFLADRQAHLFERRGFGPAESRAIVPTWWTRPRIALRRIEALALARKSPEFDALALVFKRVKNITRGFDDPLTEADRSKLGEAAERALLGEMDVRRPAIAEAVEQERFGDAMRALGALGAPVDRFFVDVLVMAEDPGLRHARLALLAELRRMILSIADISEVAPEETVRV
jgi:glycyl-tRNA synthetase beta chain